MPIAIGTKAPDFTLKSATASGLKDVRLSDNFGKKKTLILFFPLAFTGTCTQEMCDVTAGLEGYSGLGVEVLGISVDSPFAQAAWAKESKITVTLLSDLDKKVAAAYGVIFPGLAGIGDTSARAAFLVGTDGVITYAEQTATPKDLPNFARHQGGDRKISKVHRPDDPDTRRIRDPADVQGQRRRARLLLRSRR